MSRRNPPDPTVVARRTLLQGGVASALALTIVPACGNSGEPVLTGPASGGNISALDVDTLILLKGPNTFLGRDATGVYAMSAVCTHMGCLLEPASGTVEGGAACGCHGSRFDGNGAVTHGPAGRPLQHYQVDIAADGSITIQGGMLVDATARTPVA